MDRSQRAPDPSPWVARFAPLVSAAGRSGGTVLDMACGGGRHTRLFRSQGRPVVAVDRDVSRLADLAGDAGVEIVAADLEDGQPWPFEGRVFAGIVVTNYLYRPLLPRLAASLEPGGVLIYETFARGNERFGSPRNPDYLLKSGELLEVVRGKLQVIAYEHGAVSRPRPAVIQRLCAANDLRRGAPDTGPDTGPTQGTDAPEPPAHPLDSGTAGT